MFRMGFNISFNGNCSMSNLDVSLFQLTILNEKGRIWTMVAGGGASVIYADTIVDMGGVNELANYGKDS